MQISNAIETLTEALPPNSSVQNARKRCSARTASTDIIGLSTNRVDKLPMAIAYRYSRRTILKSPLNPILICLKLYVRIIRIDYVICSKMVPISRQKTKLTGHNKQEPPRGGTKPLCGC